MPFSVVLNGCDTVVKECCCNVRKKFGILDTDFLFLFVGNINENKNQMAVVDAFSLIPIEKRNHIKVLFVGGGNVENLKKYIAKKNLSHNLLAVGAIPKSDVHNYYIASDATILTSLSEGFGLSIIEGYIYGKPTVTFVDLSAYTDICTPQTSIGIERRTPEALANGMLKCMSKKWDYYHISEFGKKFSYELMKINYITLYKRILNK